MGARILLVLVGGAGADRLADPLTARAHSVTTVNGPAAARRHVAEHDLVIVAAKQTSDAVDACRRLRRDAGAAPTVLAVARSADIEERIALLEAGADDVLAEPFDARQLELLTEALLSRTEPPPSPEPAAPAPPSPSTPVGGHSRVICFAAAKGGAGTTTLAVNTAVALARRGLPVAIADLDFHHGQVAAHLDVTASQTTAELAAAAGTDDLAHELATAAVNHESGLRVYAAPLRPDQASAIGTDHVIELVRELRAAHPVLIVDAGSVPGSRALALLGLADASVIVVSPDIPGLRALSALQAVMADAGVAGEQNVFVVNRTFAAQQIGRRDIEQSLAVQIALEVPFDGESCLRAVNEGQPVIMLNPRSAVSGAVETLAAQVAGVEAPAAPVPAAAGLLGGLLGRRRA